MPDEKPPVRNFFDKIANWLTAPGDQKKGARGRLAQIFAVLGTLFATLQLLLSTVDVANRALGILQSWLPFLIPALFVAGAVLALYFLITARGNRRQTRFATGALALVVLAGAAWGVWTYRQSILPPKAVGIIIADFENQHATRGVDWGRRIFERVTDQIDHLKLGNRVDIERVFEAYPGSEQARTAGEKRRASLVLWGWYDDEGVSPHVELLQTAERFEASLAAPAQDITDFDLYLSNGPEEMAYIVSVVLGLVNFADADYAGAETLFSSAIDNAPENTTLVGLDIPYFYRASSRFFGAKASDRPMARIVADLQEAIARRPDSWQAHWNLALIYTETCDPTRRLDEALGEAEKVVELRPDDATARWLLGVLHTERAEWQQAQEAFSESVRLDPSYSEGYEMLGKALDNLGQAEESKAAYARATELRQAELKADHDDPAKIHAKIGSDLLNQGDYAGAIESLQKAVRLQPERADYHRFLGNAYYWQGKSGDAPSTRLAEAIAEYESAEEIAPDDSLLLTVLGGAYNEGGRAEEALAAYERAVQAAPCDDEALFLLASQYGDMGQGEKAEAAFRSLVALNPKQAAAWHYLGFAAFDREDYATAAADFGKAVELAPDDPTVLYGLASSLIRTGDNAGAERVYAELAQLTPDDAMVQSGWGDALLALGRTEEAAARYEAAAATEPAESYYWSALGRIYATLGRWTDAAAAFAKQVELEPENPEAYAARGWVLQQAGQFADAAGAYEAALKYAPQEGAYWEGLAACYAALDRPSDALAAAGSALKYKPESLTAYLVRAQVLSAQGDTSGARAAYTQARTLSAGNAALVEAIDAALAKLGD